MTPHSMAYLGIFLLIRAAQTLVFAAFLKLFLAASFRPSINQEKLTRSSLKLQFWSQDFHFLLQNPPGFRRGFRRVSEGVSQGVSEGFSKGFRWVLEGFLKGFRRGQLRTLEKPFENPSKTLQRHLNLTLTAF